MAFAEKLQYLRKQRGLTQEEVAEKVGVSRQAVTKWELGQGLPDVENLILLSQLLNITIDSLVKEQNCGARLLSEAFDRQQLIAFRLEASRQTYAAAMNAVEPSRCASHDFQYSQGELCYYDTYLGGTCFAGQEAIWRKGRAVYAMNYQGRVLDERFSGAFLKEALRAADEAMPYRGPAFYASGEYLYQCSVQGDFGWFQGEEMIHWRKERVYACRFHGGELR